MQNALSCGNCCIERLVYDCFGLDREAKGIDCHYVMEICVEVEVLDIHF